MATLLQRGAEGDERVAKQVVGQRPARLTAFEGGDDRGGFDVTDVDRQGAARALGLGQEHDRHVARHLHSYARDPHLGHVAKRYPVMLRHGLPHQRTAQRFAERTELLQGLGGLTARRGIPLLEQRQHDLFEQTGFALGRALERLEVAGLDPELQEPGGGLSDSEGVGVEVVGAAQRVRHDQAVLGELQDPRLGQPGGGREFIDCQRDLVVTLVGFDHCCGDRTGHGPHRRLGGR